VQVEVAKHGAEAEALQEQRLQHCPPMPEGTSCQGNQAETGGTRRERAENGRQGMAARKKPKKTQQEREEGEG